MPNETQHDQKSPPDTGSAQGGETQRNRSGTALRRLAPLDLPMVPFVAGGLVVWAVVGLVLLAFRSSLIEQGRGEWLWICLSGFLVGLPGLATMIVHDLNRRRRHAAGGR